MLAQFARRRQPSAVMSDSNKCPMGNHPWLATFLVIAFLLIFAAKKLGFL
jgi:hypothetical protein